MNETHLLTIAAVLCSWAVLVVTLVRWGPGSRKRRVRCPDKKQRASLLVEYEEDEFGSIRPRDIKACSLFPQSPVTCDKHCLTEL